MCWHSFNIGLACSTRWINNYSDSHPPCLTIGSIGSPDVLPFMIPSTSQFFCWSLGVFSIHRGVDEIALISDLGHCRACPDRMILLNSSTPRSLCKECNWIIWNLVIQVRLLLACLGFMAYQSLLVLSCLYIYIYIYTYRVRKKST